MSRFHHTGRWLVMIALCLPLIVACGQGDDAGNDTASLLPLTITEWLFPPGEPHGTSDPAGVTHLAITPLKPGDNDLTIRITDPEGYPLDAASDMTVTARPMVAGGTATDVAVVPVEGEPATWHAEDLALETGWYAIAIELAGANGALGATTIYALLPDPSVHGHDAVETPDTDPDAKALYVHAQATYGDWTTARWRESLGSGEDVLVVTNYAVDSTTPGAARMESRSRYAGAFKPRNGNADPRVRQDFAHRISIGTRWWSLDDGLWRESRGLDVASFMERADIYTGASGIQPAGVENIDGIETQVITFYVPARQGQSDGWFAWWIDPATGNILRMAMVAQMHFMVWDIYDIGAPLDIQPPIDADATPLASPAVAHGG